MKGTSSIFTTGDGERAGVVGLYCRGTRQLDYLRSRACSQPFRRRRCKYALTHRDEQNGHSDSAHTRPRPRKLPPHPRLPSPALGLNALFTNGAEDAGVARISSVSRRTLNKRAYLGALFANGAEDAGVAGCAADASQAEAVAQAPARRVVAGLRRLFACVAARAPVAAEGFPRAVRDTVGNCGLRGGGCPPGADHRRCPILLVNGKKLKPILIITVKMIKPQHRPRADHRPVHGLVRGRRAPRRTRRQTGPEDHAPDLAKVHRLVLDAVGRVAAAPGRSMVTAPAIRKG